MKGVMKMKFRNTICYILSFLLIFSVLSPCMIVGADETEEKTEAAETTENAENAEATEGETAEGEDAEGEDAEGEETEGEEGEEEEEGYQLTRDYIKEGYVNEEHKLSTMTMYFEDDKYEIWGLEETGEVAFRVKETGQILLTNPYDVPTSKSSDAVKSDLLSQIMMTYKDSGGAIVNFNSYTDAASNGQIKMTKTRQGLRVDYTLGKEQSKYLVPKQIERSSFEENILSYFEDTSSREYKQLTAYFSLQDPFDPTIPDSILTSMKVKWPITEKYAIYVLDSGISNRELEVLEGYIKGNTEYTEDMMTADYELIDYVDTSAAPALFRFAIEYSLDDNGIKIRMPATSIKYDSSNYSLQNVRLLPYFGAGSNENIGFTMVPDGSGTITRFEEIGTKAFNLTGKLYGRDYSFHTISGYTQETMRIPAYGVIESAPYTEWIPEPEETEEDVEETAAEGEETTEEATDGEEAAETAEGEEAAEAVETEAEETEAETVVEEEAAEAAEETEAEAEVADEANEEVADESSDSTELEVSENEENAEPVIVRKGYVAYLEEGDAMAEVTASHGGNAHKYSSVYSTFYPKPTDTYYLTGISSTGSASWSVTSERKYTGNYTIRVFPLSGDDIDYTDMAVEIRNYLEKNGVLSRIKSDEEATDDVPLYVENFGTIETQQKIAGFPVDVQTPLTTFEQTQNMITKLKEQGVGNLNVKLTGWYNGGMIHTAPSKLKVESALGGKNGLRELTDFAKENKVGIYPDIDFTYVDTFGSFDGFNYKDHSVKTIDGRSASHRIYNALYQGFEDDESLIIAPPAMADFYENIEKKYTELGATGISVGTLGYDLNSDHNEDYTLTREDAKDYIAGFLGDLDASAGSVMINGGNAYALQYADHILGVPLDSSLNINTSVSIPFMGMVLHGYTQFTGTALNLDGDYEYSMLKAMENGASLYFMLSMDNTSELKAFPQFSKYYAIQYDIWEPKLIETYNTFNDAMKRVKYSLITEHEYLGTRIVRVAYDNGTEFVLNYNTHDVTLDDVTTVEAMTFAVR